MISSQLGIDARFDRCGECCSEVFLWTCGCCWVGVSSSPCCSGWLCTASGLMAGRWAPVFFGVNCAGAFCLGYSALIGTRLRSCDGSSGLCSWDGAGSGASSECGESDWLEVSVPFCTGSSTADGADSDCEASSAGVVPASSGMASMVAWAYASAARAVSVAVRARSHWSSASPVRWKVPRFPTHSMLAWSVRCAPNAPNHLAGRRMRGGPRRGRSEFPHRRTRRL